MSTKPTICAIVEYRLSEQDADTINQRRAEATRCATGHRERADGTQIHAGNSVQAGDVFPMVITRVWGDQPTSAVNGQVLLDGNDTLWVTSTSVGEGPRTFSWPVRD